MSNESSEIVLYHNPMSRAQIAHWMIEEVGAPYRIELVRLDKKEQKSAEFLKLNPMGKLPTIVHRGVVVTESAGICAYLADAFPAKQLAPALDDPRRGTYLRWLFFAAACIEPAMADKNFPRKDTVPSQLGWGTPDDVLNAVEQAITPGPYVLGETFSAADVYLGSQLGWSLMMKWIEPRPRFVEYVTRLQSRPASKRAAEQNQALIAKLKAGAES
ncbi:MAG: glutathione S-transferase family protein [Polyangiales bacterium]